MSFKSKESGRIGPDSVERRVSERELTRLTDNQSDGQGYNRVEAGRSHDAPHEPARGNEGQDEDRDDEDSLGAQHVVLREECPPSRGVVR